jgi:hypothetical protein
MLKVALLYLLQCLQHLENVLHQGVLNVIFRGILELDVLIVKIISLINLIKVVVAGDCFKFTEHGEN